MSTVLPARPAPEVQLRAIFSILSHLADPSAWGSVGREARDLLREAFPTGLDGHLCAPPHLRLRMDARLVHVLRAPRHAGIASAFGLDALAERLDGPVRSRARVPLTSANAPG